MQYLKLGEEYQDTITKYKGVATSFSVFLNGCVRVVLESETTDDKEAGEFVYDIDRLIHVETGERVELSNVVPPPSWTPPWRSVGDKVVAPDPVPVAKTGGSRTKTPRTGKRVR